MMGTPLSSPPCEPEDYEEYCDALQATVRDGEYAAVWYFYVD